MFMCGGVFMPYEPYLHGKLYMQILQGHHFEHLQMPFYEDTGWQSNCSFFQEELAYYKMSAVLCYVCVNDIWLYLPV